MLKVAVATCVWGNLKYNNETSSTGGNCDFKLSERLWKETWPSDKTEGLEQYGHKAREIISTLYLGLEQQMQC